MVRVHRKGGVELVRSVLTRSIRVDGGDPPMRRIGFGALYVAVAVLVLLGATAPVAALNVGDKAPDFELPATTQEKPLKLSDFHGKKVVLLFGFVGAFTPT
jgi:hypothetical protein